eukprot:297148_1
MRFCCWECGWCWCWRQKNDVDFSVKPGVGVGGGTDDDNEKQWAKKFLGFRNTLKQWFEFDRHTSLDDDNLMFSLLLALFSADLASRDSIEGIEEESLIADEMKAIYDRDPSVIEFYLPQLCTYLANNGFDSDLCPHTMSFLLESVCRRDVRLAHRVIWHINAFCSPNTNRAAQLAKKRVEREGAISARAIQQKLGLDPFNFPASSMLQRIHLIKDNDKNITNHVETNGYENNDTIGGGYEELFYSCMNFMEALTNLSATLTKIEPNNREEYIRDALGRINEVFLCKESAGSKLVYILVGQYFYRVINIIPSESLLLATKQRVPLFLTLEVESFELNQLGLGNRFVHEVKDRGFNHQLDSFRRKLIDGFTSLREKTLSGRVQEERGRSISTSYPSTQGAYNNYTSCPPSPHPVPSENNSYLGQWADPLPKTLPVGEKKAERLRKSGSKKCVSEHFHDLKREHSNLNLNKSVTVTFGHNQVPGTRRGNEYGKTKNSPLLLTPSHDYINQNGKEEGNDNYSSGQLHFSSFSSLNEEMQEVVKDENNEYDEEKFDEMVSSDTTSIRDKDQELIIFKERWSEKEARIWQQQQQSMLCENADDGESRHHELRTRMSLDLGHHASLPGKVRGDGGDEREGGYKYGGDGGGSWSLVPIIVKANDDLRQEQAVSQLIALLARIWAGAKIGVWVRSYSIMAISKTAGIIEAIPDTLSLHVLNSHTRGIPLNTFFTRYFVKKKGGLKRARSNFVKSCAGYAIVCYLLQIKDRHNGNILLDAEGHLVHIDWGFVLGLSPGGNFGFENAPFKLTTEMVSIMGGAHSFAYQKFRTLCVEAFLEARQQREKLILLVEMLAENRDLLCFSHCDPRIIVEDLRDRFLPDKTPSECADVIYKMIATSKASWRTSIYDFFQKYSSGVL